MNSIEIIAIPDVPYIRLGDNIGQILCDAAKANGFEFISGDVICIASKAISMAEGRQVDLNTVNVSEVALSIHKKIPRKDPRILQVIIDQTEAPDGSRIYIDSNYIAGWLPNGLKLTSSGVDKLGPDEVILIPEDSDRSAKNISQTIREVTGIQVGVIVTDSDGREDKAGSTQIAIGVYGVPALRKTETTDSDGKPSVTEETSCDLLAGSAALIMGQRGTNKPAVVIRGYDYEFDQTSSISDALSKKP